MQKQVRRGDIRRVPQGVPYIQIVTRKDISPLQEYNHALDVIEYKTITLLDKRYQYRESIHMLEKTGREDYLIDSFIVMVQSQIQRIVEKGINVYLYKDTHQIDTEIVRDQKQYEYRYAIDEEDRYKVQFVYGVTDDAITLALKEAIQVINKNIDDKFGLYNQVRFIKSYGFCPIKKLDNENKHNRN